MMKRFLFFSTISSMIMLSSCDLLKDATSGLSDDEIVKGLKTALAVGTDSSVFKTSATNGYLNDMAIKILLPPEAKIIEDNIQYVNQLSILKALNINLQGMVDNTIKSMNRAAESAAKKAGPIFKNSITNLNITEGLAILNGENPAVTTKNSTTFDSIAATNYLISTTRSPLILAYKEPVDAELDKDLGLGFSTNDAWSTLTNNYNVIANTAKTALDADVFNLIPTNEKNLLKKFTPITQNSIGEYVTSKALDGLFLKVGDQEKAIRRDPWKWVSTTVSDILTKVFGGQ